MSTQALEQFAAGELKRLDDERQAAIKAKGGHPYLGSIPIGESRIQLQPTIPTDDVDQNDNARKVFLARKPGDQETYAWTINPRSPLYRELLKALPAAPVWLKIVRTGEGKQDTRYSVAKA